jgi:ribosome-binding protein aMBF1 (putative translation factor)
VPPRAELMDTFLDEFEARPEVAAHLAAARQELSRSHAEAGDRVTIRTLRLARGLSQKELADQLQTSQAAVSSYESRSRKPSEDMIRSMAVSLGVDFNQLMEALANG